MPEKPDTTWVDQQIAHLELLVQVSSRLPKGELLATDKLNQILLLTAQFRQQFLFQCELQGFKLG